MKFFSPEVALYFYKSTARSCMEYCCHIQVGAPSCCLDMLDKLQKRVLVQHSPSVLNSGSSQKCSQLESFLQLLLATWFHFLILVEGLLVVLIDRIIFLSLFLNVIRISMSIVSFLIQRGSGILYMQNASLTSIIQITLILGLINTFFL